LFGTLNISTSATVKWYVSLQRFGITYYLAVADETSVRLTWSQRRENAIPYINAGEATIKLEQIKTKRKHNKKLELKVI